MPARSRYPRPWVNSAVVAAHAAAANDYKALVCIFLYGGNDTKQHDRAARHRGLRKITRRRAVISRCRNHGSCRWPSPAVRPSTGCIRRCRVLQSLWASRNLAVVANVGTLVQPLTKAQYLVNGHGKAGKPLFAPSISSISGRRRSRIRLRTVDGAGGCRTSLPS